MGGNRHPVLRPPKPFLFTIRKDPGGIYRDKIYFIISARSTLYRTWPGREMDGFYFLHAVFFELNRLSGSGAIQVLIPNLGKIHLCRANQPPTMSSKVSPSVILRRPRARPPWPSCATSPSRGVRSCTPRSRRCRAARPARRCSPGSRAGSPSRPGT